jgi:hypothetical protein
MAKIESQLNVTEPNFAKSLALTLYNLKYPMNVDEANADETRADEEPAMPYSYMNVYVNTPDGQTKYLSVRFSYSAMVRMTGGPKTIDDIIDAKVIDLSEVES